MVGDGVKSWGSWVRPRTFFTLLIAAFLLTQFEDNTPVNVICFEPVPTWETVSTHWTQSKSTVAEIRNTGCRVRDGLITTDMGADHSPVWLYTTSVMHSMFHSVLSFSTRAATSGQE